jgi:Bacterial extracellular solute-binding proteins, family 3
MHRDELQFTHYKIAVKACRQELKTMKPVMLLLMSLIGCCAMPAWAEANMPSLVLGTNVLHKKNQQLNQPAQGGSVEHVQCILEKMHFKHHIRALPWRRARQAVHSSVIDGFFTAVASDEASDYATFSAPLVLENWYWFWRKEMTAPASWKERFQVGVILGGQQEAILTNEGFSEFVTANNTEQLVKLLMSKRVDVVLLDKEQFEGVAKKLKVVGAQYNSRFFRYMPLGVYFGSPFLAQHTDFLTAFNSRISSCSLAGFDLSASEQETIKRIVAPWLNVIRNDKELLAAVIRQNETNKTKPINQLAKIDEQWQLAFKVGNLDFPKNIVNQSLSQLLKKFAVSSKELLSEIIVMDERGYNVAMVDMTSDYWQGDEAKFLQVYAKVAQTLHFDQIKYDASSKRFQVQVSAPLLNPKSQKAIGAITLGLDVDKALSLMH